MVDAKFEINTLTRLLFWAVGAALPALTVCALGPYVGAATAVAIMGAAICAGISHSRAVYLALIIFSVAYFGSGWSKTMDKMALVAQRDAEMAAIDAAEEAALKKADDMMYDTKFIKVGDQTKEVRVLIRIPAVRELAEEKRVAAVRTATTARAEVVARYADKDIDGVTADAYWVEVAKVASVSAKELATAILVEIACSTWGSVLLLMCGVRRKDDAVVAETVAVDLTARVAELEAEKAAQLAAKRSAAAKKAAATRKANKAKADAATKAKSAKKTALVVHASPERKAVAKKRRKAVRGSQVA